MAADEGQAEYDRQVRKLRELFHGRFSFEEARELMIANGGYREAAQFVLSGDPDEVTTFIFGLSEDLRELRETSAARVYHELTSGITTSTRLFACKDCDRYWWRKVPQRKEVSMCQSAKSGTTRYPAIRNGVWLCSSVTAATPLKRKGS
ncbi:repressor of yield of DENV protein homolog [Pomacea canaliculata]|uniref:repressor of yield of DENV protein homolog n=1 Tax=Pomacea canaliculata TaxID=400727 RepID=UPI000D732C72|nr:repressor of yield of DENV protein homolog [Pomacea canaliculata]